ncbi:thiol:disulfide interchange protein DsbA/DsbL [Candidatus Ferrigenium straubiae]|jgi:thiol:disulfide interchange protein DsbA|uniref:thiol:disulfide interchange protein DsbA/DsbL n=1 Tax=Candidatus Ferrigenium straubiae TaxID=2919506 RepID=UPI003F4AC8EB
MFKNLFVAALLLIGSSAFAAVEIGRDYKLLNPPQPAGANKIEVLEFFFYGCSHCFHLHPQLSAWEKTMPKDVDLIYVPTIFRDSWEPMARTFYALESLGQLHQHHDALYKAWNVDNEVLGDEAKVLDFLVPRGVDRTKFSAAYNSFSMQSKVVRAKQMIRSYSISGTPTLVVDGKYMISGLQPADAIRVLNEVIEMARKERAAKMKAKQK